MLQIDFDPVTNVSRCSVGSDGSAALSHLLVLFEAAGAGQEGEAEAAVLTAAVGGLAQIGVRSGAQRRLVASLEADLLICVQQARDMPIGCR